MGDDKVLNSKFLLHTLLRHNHAFDSTIFKLCEFAQFMINGKYFVQILTIFSITLSTKNEVITFADIGYCFVKSMTKSF